MDFSEKEFEKIIRRNKKRLKHLCRVYANRREDEKDLFQEIVVEIWRSLSSFKGDAKIDTWIYRLAINTAISFIRKKKTRKKYHSKYHKEKDTRKEAPEIITGEKNEKVESLYKAIEELDTTEKAIITMYLDNFSYAEIAYVTDITENYVGVKLHRIKNKLSKMINQ
ncbi:MAG: RNA polymerase sigma factor [Balneolaceae bacterium]|nr:RNA polymerase sigma factor [Balneolaceae bacterium]